MYLKVTPKYLKKICTIFVSAGGLRVQVHVTRWFITQTNANKHMSSAINIVNFTE